MVVVLPGSANARESCSVHENSAELYASIRDGGHGKVPCGFVGLKKKMQRKWWDINGSLGWRKVHAGKLTPSSQRSLSNSFLPCTIYCKNSLKAEMLSICSSFCVFSWEIDGGKVNG